MPEATTLSRFRLDLAEAKMAETVFTALNEQLERRGLVIKAGTMIDATLVEADVRRSPLREGEVSTLDPAAGFTRRGQRSFFGTHAHLAVDHRSSAGRSIHPCKGRGQEAAAGEAI